LLRIESFFLLLPVGLEFTKMHLSEPTVQPNTKVLLARKGGERENIMKIVKCITLAAFAALALGMSACHSNNTPPPAPAKTTTGYSK
jgi:hypothetical protein